MGKSTATASSLPGTVVVTEKLVYLCHCPFIDIRVMLARQRILCDELVNRPNVTPWVMIWPSLMLPVAAQPRPCMRPCPSFFPSPPLLAPHRSPPIACAVDPCFSASCGFRGVDDLRDGIIRTPLSPMITFRDDPLRVLRAVRFAARFGFALHEVMCTFRETFWKSGRRVDVSAARWRAGQSRAPRSQFDHRHTLGLHV